MAKLTAPLASLGASGRVGPDIVFSQTTTGPSGRRRAIPSGAVTLPQQYQRWDYRFAVTTWNALSPAVKLAYEADAVTFHMSGMSLYLQQSLPAKPQLLARYRLDETSGAAAHDTSSHLDTAVITGTNSLAAVVSSGRRFNAASDSIDTPAHAYLTPTANAFTFACFIRTIESGVEHIIAKYRDTTITFSGAILRVTAANRPQLQVGDAGTSWKYMTGDPQDFSTFKHLACTFDGDYTRFYIDGVPLTPIASPYTVYFTTSPINLGRNTAPVRLRGDIDEFSWWDCALTQAQIQLLAARRWPL